MTIRNLPSYIEALWDWGFLDACFGGTRIKVSDVDGIVERQGNVLIIEAKRPGVSVPKGQQILFRALAKLGCTVLVLWGEKNQPYKFGLFFGQKYWERDASSDRIKELVANWFNWANVNPFKR